MFVAFLALFAVVGCSTTPTTMNSPQTISAKKGKELMANDPSIILVDVRTESEYLEIRIDGALLLPLSSITLDAIHVLPDKNATIILYCRSGNRSAQAAQLLDGLGYTKIYDMGGILDWPYDTVSG
ncbi:MAG: rhodanese-like domain-containing protein [Bacillus subtilis]|nr:rhodanese-like domain-containing protein [Bacillus subtilis]